MRFEICRLALGEKKLGNLGFCREHGHPLYHIVLGGEGRNGTVQTDGRLRTPAISCHAYISSLESLAYYNAKGLLGWGRKQQFVVLLVVGGLKLFR